MISGESARAGQRLLTVLLVGAFLAQAVHGLLVKSGTCDELGAHLPAGILFWRSGEPNGGLANPPLGQLMIAAGPVLTGTADRPLGDAPGHLLPARIPVLLLGLVTVLLVGGWARSVGGAMAGLAALGAAATSPNLIAHARLATLDLPLTAFVALAGTLVWRAAKHSRPHALFASAAVAIGAACATKFTALHVVPALAIGAFVYRGREGLGLAARILVAALAGLIVVGWLAYALDPAAPRLYADAIADKWAHGRAGHFSYLLGERSDRGFPHYFVIALAVKVPLALLVAAFFGARGLLRSERKGGEARAFAGFVLFPALWIFAAMSLVHRVDIGLRHVLPVLPPLLALAGLGWARLWRMGGVGRVVSVVLVGWLAAAALRTTPDHLAYFNELAGGAKRGDRVLIDSNLDWGQDEHRFRTWARDREVVVNPPWPREGIVAANVNAIRGVLSRDDRKLRWLDELAPWETIGHTWRIYLVTEEQLREGSSENARRALDYARFLLGRGEASEAIEVLTRNDLSHHEKLAEPWSAALAEAQMNLGALREAIPLAARARDRDLNVELAFRISEARAIPWSERDPRERSAVFAALWRRGRGEEAVELATRVSLESPDEIPARYLDPEAWPAGGDRLTRATFLAELGRERLALEAVGALLAEEPGNEEALWLYGELVVRRKLGLTEYPLPSVDWSALGR